MTCVPERHARFGLSSDMGWGESEDQAEWGIRGSLLLVLATSMYWTATWLVSGCPPLTRVVTLTRGGAGRT